MRAAFRMVVAFVHVVAVVAVAAIGLARGEWLGALVLACVIVAVALHDYPGGGGGDA